ncbi:MAG: hypothetical protein U1E22_01635, partial [Coriobacteriia bacterium]|nr:hypothetical protein [Coriobacteriia bacterium]
MRFNRGTKGLMGFVLATVFVVALSPGFALAADPPSGPTVIRTEGFENALPSYWTVYKINDPAAPKTAFWGRMKNIKRTGTWSLWCGGRKVVTPSTDTTATWGSYLTYTGGYAVLDLPELADYYSSTLDFYYTMPTLGFSDTISFGVDWGSGVDPGVDNHFLFPLTAANVWSPVSYSLADTDNKINLSRKSGYVDFLFVDIIEPASKSPKTGQGTSLDDLAVKGYRYGPVRTLAANRSGGTTTLTWLKPYRATGSTTPEERAIVYKIWRRQAAPTTGAWTELTGPSGLPSATLTYDDVAALSDSAAYEYRVHVFGASDSYYSDSASAVISTSGDVTPPVVTSNANTSLPYVGSASIAISASDAGIGVKSISYRWNGGSTTTVTGSSATAMRSVLGAATLEYWATDWANNVSAHVFKTITIVAGPVPVPLTTERVADGTRFSTAVAIARESFDADPNAAGTQWTGVKHVVIASGEDAAAADL